jgi:hypothetical protein
MPVRKSKINEESYQGSRPVLKIRFDGENGQIIPNPWLLMVKAAVNFSWVAYGFKLLPVCVPPPDDVNEEYEQALLEHEQRLRERDVVPSTLTIPATPVTVPSPAASTHPTKVTTVALVKPPDGEELWENLSDSSFY